jgi:uncharacterized protein YjbI with pentapeptide repeats
MNAGGSFFTRSILVACDLRGANLFRADLAQMLGDDGTLFDQAYLEQIKFLPRLALDTH